MVIALWPRHYTGELAAEGDFTLHTWPRLLRFPPFWLGLALMGYIVTGAINPSWERISTGIVWYIKAKESTSWLPTSIEAPFANMNAWRMLTIYSAPWLLACALWTGLTRRMGIQTIFTVVVANGVVLSLIAIIQKMSGAEKILWFIKTPASYFHGTFVYKNHAGTYFNIILACAVGLAIWHHVRGLRRLERGSPAPIFAFSVIVIGACVLLSASRAAMILLGAYFLVGTIIYLIWRSRSRTTGPGNPAFTGLVAVCTVLLLAGMTYALNLSSAIDQFKALATPTIYKSSVTMRVQAREATYDLFRDNAVTGWGAGSFRHAFPVYQQSYPEILRAGSDYSSYFFWEYAHNDYLQALAELGVIGFLFPVLALIWATIKFCRLGPLIQPGLALIGLGLGVTLVHAWVDFPLYNPAILGTFCAIGILLVRWAELETRP